MRPAEGTHGLDADSIRRDFIQSLLLKQAKFPEVATKNDHYLALAHTIRDRLLSRWAHTARTYLTREVRTVAYLSAEYLPGPQLGNALVCLGIWRETEEAMRGLGIDLDGLFEQEEEPGLGNGGLGRLAACFMDSLATLEIPAIGYGIRYEFGIFDQEIREGWQVEIADKWLHLGNPWEIPRYEIQYAVPFGGHTEPFHDATGRYAVRWVPERVVKGIPFDTPVMGYGVTTANFLRLWQATAAESFDFQAFNVGDYYKAVEEKVTSETITKVLYPNDSVSRGKQLRLEQQFFFVSCSLQDMIRLFRQRLSDLRLLDQKFTIQLNDTHPALAVAELMRLLVDVHHLTWEEGWEVTRNAFGYTNHTLMPEALETWPLPLFARSLPRHLEIIFEINRRFLDEVRERFPGDEELVRRVSLIDEHGQRSVRMANLACVASKKINGVARLHSDLLKTTVLADFYRIWPDKFTNVTNGITPRRFVFLSNPKLTGLITEAIGTAWKKDLDRLKDLEPLANDAAFRKRWREVKLENKRALAAHLSRLRGFTIEPESLFDVQVKRIHEYKRQHLNILRVIISYMRLQRGLDADAPPRTVFFGGKAAPGYFMAKLIIRLIHGVAEVIDQDPAAKNRLKVVFVPDFNVKVAQHVYPAADLSEQISTAGYEASGTGNMKFTLNGALTVGTLDGANVEIREEVGPENFFLFGLDVDGVNQLRAKGYRPLDQYERDLELKEAIDLIASGRFSRGDPSTFAPLVRNLLDHDHFLVLADVAAYCEAQRQVDAAFKRPDHWAKLSILNVARGGKFSSDRSIREYAANIWEVQPVKL
jgi:glycogen phosphorylase